MVIIFIAAPAIIRGLYRLKAPSKVEPELASSTGS
jgi:hypothetical protein